MIEALTAHFNTIKLVGPDMWCHQITSKNIERIRADDCQGSNSSIIRILCSRFATKLLLLKQPKVFGTSHIRYLLLTFNRRSWM